MPYWALKSAFYEPNNSEVRRFHVLRSGYGSYKCQTAAALQNAERANYRVLQEYQEVFVI